MRPSKDQLLTMENDSTDLVDLITDYQGRLYGFLFSILGHPDQANEVLQETNLVLWRKSSEFQLGSNFKAWSFRIASLQALAYRQKKLRDRLVFDDELFHDMVHEATEADRDDELDALEVCIAKLPEKQSQMINLRYLDRLSIKEVAEKIGKKENAVMQTLFRVRKALSECIEQRILKTP